MIYEVLGAYASTTGAADAIASKNEVTITDSTVGDYVYGGYAFSDGGNATASDNTVTISGSTVYVDVHGGYADSDGMSMSGIANGNTVTITDSTVTNSSIYGGYSYADFGPEAGEATGNTVTLISSGALDLTGSRIYGGFVDNGSGAAVDDMDAFTGNTLNVKAAGLTVSTIAGFENLNFYLPDTLVADDTVLTVTGTAYLNDANAGGDGSISSKINVGIDGAASPLQVGDEVTLIDASSGILLANTDLNTTANGSGMQGVTLKYEFDIAAAGNKLTALVTSVGTNEQAKAFSEGFLSGMTLANVGGDLVASEAMSQAVSTAQAPGGPGFGSFGAATGGSTRYESGSHIDVSGFSLAAGIAWGRCLTPGNLTFGTFFEYGYGSYDTYNSFAAAASVRGDGSLHYFGGGILGRLDFTETASGRFFAEASARLGRLNNKYSNSDLASRYESSSGYYGMHLGAGYTFNIGQKTSLELSGRYFWTRQKGDAATLSTGERVEFEDADSSRVRVGARYAYALNDRVSPYMGAAYEYEFGGEAKATTNGLPIDAPSMRGGTGVGELGVTLKPSRSLPLAVDLGVQGYVGKRQGVTGALRIALTF